MINLYNNFIYMSNTAVQKSRSWSHPVVLNTGPLDWESSTLTTRPLNHQTISWNDLNISLDNNLESIFIEVNLPEKKNFICGCIYKDPSMSIADFNSKYLTLLLEKLNREDTFCFLMGDFNINLIKINSESYNSHFYNTMCHISLCHLFFKLHGLLTNQKL